MGCQQCGRQPGDLYCLYDDGCPNDPQYEPRQDWACEPAPDRHELPRCFRCGHLLHAGECVNVNPQNDQTQGGS